MKIKLLLFFLLAVSTKLLGQVGFQENLVLGEPYTTKRPQLVKAADLDGDNDLDIVTFGRELNWYENVDGQANFDKKHNLSLDTYGPPGTSLQTVDFDNDGDLDILSSIANKFTLYENTNGLGNFVVKQVTELGPSYYDIVVTITDVNGDGNVDILCFYIHNFSGPFQGKLVWYENDGTGSFGAEKIITTSNDTLFGASLLFVEDLDGDNKEDIIIGHDGFDKIIWLKNMDGNGTFNLPTTVTLLADGITAVYTADIDNDGDMDIVSASKNDNQVAWYENLDGLGVFSGKKIITSNAISTNAVLATDINSDNTIDIVYTGTNEIGWLSNTDGLGNFANAQIISTKAFGVRSVIIADLDGDGKKDLISASEDDDKVAWYKHIDGNGTFDRQVTIAKRIISPNYVYPGDFDGDGDVDLLVNSQHDAKLTWLENVNGLGFYSKEHIVTEDTDVGNYTPIAYPIDIDGDGDLDIASVQNSKLFWYENVDGKGNFTIEHMIDATSANVSIIRAADLDGDGDMDLVCGSYTSNKIAWYKNLNSAGTFGQEQIIMSADSNGSLTSLEIADMDGDNDMDIIASSYTTATYYFKNTNGLGNFALQYMPIFTRKQAVYPADIDGDGDNDIIGVNSNGGNGFESIIWYENSNGQGNFTVKHDISTLTIHGKTILAADLDGDGDIDVLTAAGHQQTSGQLAWYQNNGSGVFSPRIMIHELFNNSTAQDVNIADVDNDGDLDVLSIFGHSGSILALNKVSVFENLVNLGNTISGKVLIDTNANGCTDDDIKGANLMVISNNGTNSFATFTDENGAYNLATTAGNFTTAITSQLPNYFISAPTSHTSNFSGMNNAYSANFCVAPIGQVNELIIEVYPSLNDLRPGFDTNYHIVYKNTGTTTLSGTVDFEFDGNKMNFLAANQTVSSQVPNKLTFDFTSLHPLETRTIDLEFNVFAPPVTNINDEVISVATITSASEEDNSFSLNQIVIGSYDPNDITCLEGDQVLIEDAGKYLHYMIRFQNTGTASAINVRVENILDSKLDWTSLQLESLSHSGRVEITDGSKIKFIFDNIYLPDSITNEPNSHGFITYKIKPLNSVAAGDIIHNTADIYFDFNPPIVTNTASTQFMETLSTAEADTNRFSIYPNPTSNIVNIKGNSAINKVSLIDINGRVLKDLDFNTETSSIQIDLTDLTNGIYFLKINSDQGNTSKKIIKR